MIHVICRTALNVCNEEWPSHMPTVPRVGDIIESKTKRKNNAHLELQVTSVTWRWNEFDLEWHPHIELHMTNWQRLLMPRTNKDAAQGSIIAFYDWYAPLVGRSPSAFI